MHLKIFVLFLLLLFTTTIHYGQSKKDLRKNKVKLISEYIEENESGNKVSYKSSDEKINANGDIIESIAYNKDGSVKKKTLYAYNANNDVKEETVYSGSGKLMEKTTFSYNARGEKTIETITDENGKVIKKTQFEYDAGGFRSERKSYDGNGKLVSVKKYTYKK